MRARLIKPVADGNLRRNSRAVKSASVGISKSSRVDEAKLLIPDGVDSLTITLHGKEVVLTHLTKVFWPSIPLTKADLLRYYVRVAPHLLPHITGRAIVMKRYPNGIDEKFFYMKRAPKPHPEWLKVCTIEHSSGNVIDFPVIDDMASLLWLINLGCVDINQWYGHCATGNLPEYLHFDLDPVEGTSFAKVRRVAILVHEALEKLGMPNYVKTTGATGMHVYVPIKIGPEPKRVWTFAKKLAVALAQLHPKLITSEYRIHNRPRGTVLVDYNQNSWGKTLASIYSVRPVPAASVSAPVTWPEVHDGLEPQDFTVFNMRERLSKVGDLWKPLLSPKARIDLEKYL